MPNAGAMCTIPVPSVVVTYSSAITNQAGASGSTKRNGGS